MNPRCLIWMLLLWLPLQGVAQQMQKNEHLQLASCAGRGVVMVRNVPGRHMMREHYTSSATIAAGTDMRVNVSLRLCDPSSRVVVYDGEDASGTVLGEYTYANTSGDGVNEVFHSTSGSVYVYYETFGGETCEDIYTVSTHTADLQDTAYNMTSTTVDIDWVDYVNSSWTIYYGTSPDNLDHSVSTSEHPFHLTGLDPSQQYYYRVVAQSATTAVPDVCPVYQFATGCAGQLTPRSIDLSVDSATLTWNDAGCSEYTIHYGQYPPYQEYHTTSQPATITGLQPFADYYFRIFCGNVSVESVPSTCPVYHVVTDPIISHYDVGSCRSVLIDWTDSLHSSWWITYSRSGGNPQSVLATSHPFRLTGLRENSTYYYRVTPANQDPNSDNRTFSHRFETPCCFSLVSSTRHAASTRLEWDDYSAGPWVVYLREGNSLDIRIADTVDTTVAYISGLREGVTYYVYVATLGEEVNRYGSCWKHFTTSCSYGLEAVALGPHTVELNWDDSEADRYYFFCGEQWDAMELRDSADASPHVLDGLNDGTEYMMMVSAVPMRPSIESAPCTTTFTTPCLRSRVSDVGFYSALIDWDDPMHRQWVLRYGTSPERLDHVVHTNHHPYQLTGLHDGTAYYYHVSYLDMPLAANNQCIESFSTICDQGFPRCIDFDNFYSCFTKCYTGRYYDTPFTWEGFTETTDEMDSLLRHVVVRTRTFDPRCTRPGDTLWTLPDGAASAVRLGSWRMADGYPSQAIRYRYHVDASANDLLILRYAVALYNEGHNRNEQPRFQLTIRDSHGEAINPSCYSALIIPQTSYTSDWRRGSVRGFQWKDWTSLGIDLSPLDGQDIYVELTVQDCHTGIHPGYVYFTLECANSHLRTTSCGDNIATTFRAPEGFRYEWYSDDAPSTILSTADSLHVTRPGIYHCRMNFTGQNASARCQFTSTSIAATRYPVARFVQQEADSFDCRMRVLFSNQSRIALDADHEQLTDLPCEEYEWIVDDSDHYYVSDLRIPLTTVDTHKVQLVAKLAGGLCTDTMTGFVHFDELCPDFIYLYDTICEGDTFRFHGRQLTSAGTYDHRGTPAERLLLSVRRSSTTVRSITGCDSLSLDGHTYDESQQLRFPLTDRHGCDSLDIVNLSIFYTHDLYQHDTCVENALPWNAAGTTFHSAVADTVIPQHTPAGCDNRLHYSLHVWPNVFAEADTQLCDHDLPYQWHALTFYGPGTQTQRLVAMEQHGADSIVRLTVRVASDTHRFFFNTLYAWELPSYFQGRLFYEATVDDTIILTRANGCDSVFHYTLRVIDSTRFPDCGLYLQFPNFVSANGDGINDRFVIVNLLEESCFVHTLLVIYNRWGAEMYRVNNIRCMEDFWSPAEQNAPTGTYFYHFKGASLVGSMERNGVIEVIR